MIPDQQHRQELADGTVTRLNVPGVPLIRSAGLITRKEAFQRPVANALAEEIRQSIKLEVDEVQAAETA